MRYFVIGDDGQKYGPADVPTLQAWIAEGRLLPTQQVEEEASGARSAARAVPGLNFPLEAAQPGPQAGGIPQGSPYAQAPGTANYPRQGNYAGGDDGKQDVTMAWVMGVLGFFCCFLFSIYGIVCANKAKAKGNPGGQTALIAVSIMLALNICIVVFRTITVLTAVQNGTLPGMQRNLTK